MHSCDDLDTFVSHLLRKLLANTVLTIAYIAARNRDGRQQALAVVDIPRRNADGQKFAFIVD